MATNKSPWIGSLAGADKPLVRLGLFQAGSTQAIKRGELLELDTGNWVPLTSDKSMSGIVAVANEEIRAGDRAGYYEIIVPRPLDVFRFALASAAAAADGASVYVSDSQTVTLSGSNALGDVVSQDHFPAKQGHLTDDASPDSGTTIRSTAEVGITINSSASYYAALQG